MTMTFQYRRTRAVADASGIDVFSAGEVSQVTLSEGPLTALTGLRSSRCSKVSTNPGAPPDPSRTAHMEPRDITVKLDTACL